ncbi:MAG: RluA family pseudouridine synthase [Acidimicrobiia bacterium]
MQRARHPVPEGLIGERADKIVAELAGVSRDRSRRLFDQGVTVDGKPVQARDRLTGGVIEFQLVPKSAGTLPEDVSFAVRYEDEYLLVVDKPAGIVTHPGAGQARGSLAAGLLHRYPDIEGVGQPGRWGIVHRLDQGTSGVLVVARTPHAYEYLIAELAARRIHRTYLALVHGVPAMATGTIDAPIGRDPAHPTRKRVSTDGRPARTHYRVSEDLGVAALLEIELETGRTHQIRVHLAAIDHPVVGDRTYSRRTDPIRVRRIFLHAARIRFAHPISEHTIEVDSPLPAELAGPLDQLRRRFSARTGTVEP